MASYRSTAWGQGDISFGFFLLHQPDRLRPLSAIGKKSTALPAVRGSAHCILAGRFYSAAGVFPFTGWNRSAHLQWTAGVLFFLRGRGCIAAGLARALSRGLRMWHQPGGTVFERVTACPVVAKHV